MPLSDKDRRLVRLTAAIVLGHWDEVERVRKSAPAGEPDRAWREAVLQTHLFAGFPRLVEAYERLDRAGGLGARHADEERGGANDAERGVALFERIYGERAGAVRARLAAFHPDFADWTLGHAYARVLARPGLGADRRELLAVAALAATGQDRQLASHARGSVRCGATRAEVLAVLDVIDGLARPERLERARTVLERFARESG